MQLQVNREALRQFCQQRGIARLELFGSAMREDFRPDSDVDILATLRPDSSVTLLGWVDIQEKLSEMFGRSVDLVSRPAIERSKNWIRRKAILTNTLSLYEE